MAASVTAQQTWESSSGIDFVHYGAPGGAVSYVNFQGKLVSIPQIIAASGAIDPHTAANYVITKSSAAAVMTLAAPTLSADDGIILIVTSNTAQAHTITATGLFQDGAGHVNLATFAANAGASMSITAYQGKWNVLYLNAVTMS